MKQLFTKQLALLVMMFFTSLGSAFGYTITFNFNGANATGSNVNAYFICSDYQYWVDHENPLEVSAGDNVQFRVEPNSLYVIKKILLDNVDITAEHDPSIGYELSNISADHTVSVECEKVETNTISLNLSNDEVSYVSFSGENGTNLWTSTQVSGPIEVPKGGSVRMRINLFSTVYLVKKVLINDVEVTSQVLSDEGYLFSDVQADHVVNIVFEKLESRRIKVNWAEHLINVCFKDVESGFRMYGSDLEFAAGKSVRMMFDIENGYDVKRVTIYDSNDNPIPVTSSFKENGYYEFVSLSDDYEVDVVLEPVPMHSITVNYDREKTSWINLLNYRGDPDIGNSTNPEPGVAYSFTKGTNARLSFGTDDVMYELESIMIDGTTDVASEYVNNGYYDISNLTADHTVAVSFKKKPVLTLTYDTYQGSVSFDGYWMGPGPDNARYLSTGSVVRLFVNTNPAFKVGSITVNGAAISMDDYYANGYCEFTVNEDCEVNVTFEKLPALTVNYNDELGRVEITDFGGVVSGNEYAYLEGSSVKLSAYPFEGYEVGTITLNGTPISISDYYANGYYELTVNEDCEVNVTFEKMPVLTVNFNNELGQVNVSVYDNISPSYPFAYHKGADVRLAAYPSFGYKVGSITVNGAAISMDDYYANDYYEFTINEDCQVDVTFKEAEWYQVHVDYNEGGQVGFGNMNENWWNTTAIPPIIEGSVLNLYIEPNVGFVPTAYVDGEEVALTYDLVNQRYSYVITDDLKADVNVSVTFNEIGYSILHSSFNGSLAEVLANGYYLWPDGERNFTKGSTVRATIKTRIGYEVESVLLDNTQLTADENGYYVFVVPDADYCYLSVTIQKVTAPPTVPFSLSESGIGTFCSQYDLDFSNMSGIKAYVASGYNPTTSELVLTRVNEVPAGTGLLIKGTSGDYAIPTKNTNYMYANMLRGIVESESILPTNWYKSWMGDMEYMNYLLGSDGMFYPANDELLEAYRAYLLIPVSAVVNSSAKISTIFLDDEEESDGIATGIGFIWAGESAGKTKAANTDDVYNLQGQKVNSKTLKPGIYIRNGKKFMVK